MKFKVPKVAAVLNFLQARGWTLEHSNDYSHWLNPPDWMAPRFSEKFHFMIPAEKFEKAKDYPRLMDNIISNISIFYQMDRTEVENILSPTWDDAVNAPSPENASLANAA